MAQSYKKNVLIHPNTKHEIKKFTKPIRKKFYEFFIQLRTFGKLSYPEGRKLIGHDLFEIRIRENGTYRSIYCYDRNRIIILSAFRKKTQKTPRKEIEKAITRKSKLNNYKNEQ